MLLGFRQFTIRRQAAGQYVKGQYVKGATSDIVIEACVQGLVLVEMANLPQGRHQSDNVKIYTQVELVSSKPNIQPDILLLDGDKYEIWQIGDHQYSPHLNHFVYYASKLLKSNL